jgi:hypothetical protein
MAKKRRPPLSATERAALVQPLLERALGLPPSHPSPGQDRELDIAPLLAALRTGALDGTSTPWLERSMTDWPRWRSSKS